MAQFFVYEAAPYTPGQHRIVRVGVAPESDIADQAGPGEVAVVGAAAASTKTATYWYDPATGDLGLEMVSTLPSAQETYDRWFGGCREMLRATEWAMLPDGPLSRGRVRGLATTRAWRPSRPPNAVRGAEYALTPPAYPEIGAL